LIFDFKLDFNATVLAALGMQGRLGLAWRPFSEHGFLMLPDEQASPEQIEIFRRMTPEQRWQAAHRLYWTMRRHKAAFVHSQHPGWSDRQVEEQVRQIFSNRPQIGILPRGWVGETPA